LEDRDEHGVAGEQRWLFEPCKIQNGGYDFTLHAAGGGRITWDLGPHSGRLDSESKRDNHFKKVHSSEIFRQKTPTWTIENFEQKYQKSSGFLSLHPPWDL
jgi:hypothetical protein